MIVVDTDILIEALRGRSPAAARITSGIERGALATTAVTAFELRSGVRPGEQRDAIEALLAGFAILPLDDHAAQNAAECRRQLEAKGQTIDMADYLIAGGCLSRGASLPQPFRANPQPRARPALKAPAL
jgi:predicted nucleic acid-binding protein